MMRVMQSVHLPPDYLKPFARYDRPLWRRLLSGVTTDVGSSFVWENAYQIGGALICHPSIYERIRREVAAMELAAKVLP